MKTCKIFVVICLALLFCLGVTACKGDAEPVIVHCAKGIDEDVLQTKIVETLGLAEGTTVEVSGEFNLAMAGKYTITCKWENEEKEISLWVYENSVNVIIDGKVLSGDTVHFNYNKAVASENFTNCINIIDCFGNPLSFTIDNQRCMDFENKDGSYLMYYNVTDAAGQTFSVRVIYEVTYEHYISVANGVALVYEDSAIVSADFDGATEVWLEDANGKIDPAFYEIKENSILIKKEYYNALVGKKVAIQACSNNGSSYFYLNVCDKNGYNEYLNSCFVSMISYQSSYVTFDLVKEAPEGISFDYGYHYTKKSGRTVDQTALLFHTIGKYGRIAFDLYVKDSFDKDGNKDMEFQIANGARFVSVTDSNGNVLSIIDKNNKPHVVLTTGETYHIVLDIHQSFDPAFYIWGGRTVDLYYYNFEFGKSEYTYILDSAKETIVCKKDGETYGYFAWPTVAKLDGDRLIAVSSGFRQAHIDIESKVAVWYSEDGGKTWSEPQVLADTLLDDRDAGVVYWNGKIIVSWFCASKEYYIKNNAGKYSSWAAGIDDDYDTKYMGGNYIISEDGGKTWSDIYTMPEGMFTPHGLIVNPDGGLTSVGYLKYDKVNKRWGTGIAVRTTTGEMNENGFIWSDPIVIADSDTQYSWDFQEPYGIYNDDGVLIVVMRADKGLYQCELQPGETEFSEWHKIAFVQESPAHMIKHSSGVMIMTYGYRGLYIDPVTGNSVNYKDRNKDTTTLGIRARLSYDGGLTWTREVVLTSRYQATTNENTSDWGYTSTVELSDGKLLTLYYKRTGSETKASIYQVVWELPNAITGDVTINFVNGLNGQADDGFFIDTVTGQVGGNIEFSTLTKEGYEFGGWYLDTACSIPFMGTTYTQDLSLYAKWIKK